MDIEKRLDNLERLINSVIKKIENDKFYQAADIEAERKNISAITPKIFTKTAYIDDTEVVFSGVPSGNLSVYADNLAYRIERTADMVRISFEALSEVKNITISIL